MLTLIFLIFVAFTVALIYVGERHFSVGETVIDILGIISLTIALFAVVADVVLLLNVICFKPSNIEYKKAECQVEIIEANKLLTVRVKECGKRDGKSYGVIDSDTLICLYPELGENKIIYDAIEEIKKNEEEIKDLDRKLIVELPIMRFLVYFGH